ncbi:uncharacterized protein LOC131997003 [Stomoxys calcitrans]|uniref:uncharacterized protein LOC131997003 n=1 Tax=Stomoxys calcitrans TaxID=35570 RepID=UPI0027E3A538|nr:uncharacterized protein LOC131997003 [Stomoxys calcitrans]
MSSNTARPAFTSTLNNNATFINKPSSQSSLFPANLRDSVPPSFLNTPQNLSSTDLTYQQINARQTVPKDLPAFGGNPTEWPLFSSTYDWSTAVCGLTDAENLVRLQKALRGDALQAVQHILIHPSCVATAMATLKLLYGQPEKILHSLKMKIRSLPPINANKLDTITSFAVQVKGLQATIEACDLLDELNNSSLLQELISKLPSYFQINWGTFKMNLAKQNKRVNLSEFSNWIFDIGLSASSVNIESLCTSAAVPVIQSKQRNAYVHTHAEENSNACMLCGGDCRNIPSCEKFITADRAQRWEMVREFQLCKQCLRKHYGPCNANVCGKEGCQYKHHCLLHKTRHNEGADKNKQATSMESQNNAIAENSTHSCNTHSASIHNNFFKIIPVTIYGSGDKLFKTYAFIDEGSSTSLIEEQIMYDLNLSGSPEPLCLKWTGNVEREEQNSSRLCITLAGPNQKRFKADVRTVKHLSLPKQTVDCEAIVQAFPYLKGIPIQGYKDAVPRILIGLNNSRLCISQRIKEGKANQPVAICTRLGWLLCGSSKGISSVEYHHCHVCECNVDLENNLDKLIKRFYCLESSGISCTMKALSDDDSKAIAIMEKYTKQRPDSHYETALLWRDENEVMPNSYEMAKKRYLCLEKRLKADKDLDAILNKTISEYVSKGYITRVTSNDMLSAKKLWYLPIFPVFNKNKPGKTRIVWDAAATVNGVSLNSMLFKGPDLLSSLPDILFRFRQKSVAICGDIEQMFHQIFIREEDRNVQRFLWRAEDGDEEPNIFIMNVMIFGASCAPCISQFVKNLNANKYRNQFPAAANAIVHNHYVDDFLDSVDTIEEAIHLARNIKYVHSKAGFNIRNWICNNSDVLKAINGEHGQNQKDLNLGSGVDTDKVLGIFWSSRDDFITFKVSPHLKESNLFVKGKTPTKRNLLRILMTIYDPLGLIGHFLMYLKIVLQEVWRSGVGWDEEIHPPQMTKWTNWLSHLSEIEDIKIPRCYLQTFKSYHNLDVELHTFADASENGYAAISYLRISDGSEVVISLVGSKTKVAPLKMTSIPRLELMAALIASRFATSVVNSATINIRQRYFWSDSKTVISWIKSDHRRYHQFVAFRVSEILELTELSDWRWVPGKLNVADEATKWKRCGPDLSNGSRWMNGPDFLREPQDAWPTQVEIQTGTDCEQRHHILAIDEVSSFVNIERFSQWRRAMRAVAYAIHYINKLRKPDHHCELTQDELIKAETVLLKQAQKVVYNEEIALLMKGEKVSKSSAIFKLCAFVAEDGVLRIDGRIDRASVTKEMKYPAILPKDSYITMLLIMHYHCSYRHGNNETAINEIRQKFYIPRLRTIFKKVVRKCQMCKVKKARPVYPQMAKLPRARLSAYVAPFTFTGLDFFGPLLVTVNRHKEKRYGALFTCLTIRAVHIEIVHSLNTSSCILAIRNFVARRGTPREIFSDNGTNFVGAERELREAIKQMESNEFVRHFTTATTKWNFNPPSAPHMGGVWERMVRSVKTVLYRIMPTRSPNDETLVSMMSEVENIINSRPLTYVPIDNESQEALTPNHLLLGSSNGMKPLVEYDDSVHVLKSSWLETQQFAQRFWRRWLAEYLPSLTCRSKWFEKSKPLRVGDLVVVVDPANPRNVWPRGKVLSTKMAEDGQVRSAKIMTYCGVLERPVAKLAVLDVAQVEE